MICCKSLLYPVDGKNRKQLHLWFFFLLQLMIILYMHGLAQQIETMKNNICDPTIEF